MAPSPYNLSCWWDVKHKHNNNMYLCDRVATVREKVQENEKFSRSGKSQGITFSVREIKKNEKSHGKVREFQNFPKKMLVNRLLEILVSIIGKQY